MSEASKNNPQQPTRHLYRSVRMATLVCVLTLIPIAAFAQIQTVDEFAGTSGDGLIDTIVNIINAFLVLAAIAAIVYIIISGVRFFASQGDDQEVQQARRSLVYAVIGIIVIMLAIVIVRFITDNASG